jgi:hypothetical protein
VLRAVVGTGLIQKRTGLTPCPGTEVSELHVTSLIFPEKKDSTLHTVKKQHQKGPDSSGLHAHSDQGATKLKILNE